MYWLFNISRGRACIARGRSLYAAADKDFMAEFLFGPSPQLFRSLGLDERICRALASTGKEAATIIQAGSFAPIIGGQDVLLTAETGTGKTLAYLCPLFQVMLAYQNKGTDEHRSVSSKYPAAVVLVPNKELGCQGTVLVILVYRSSPSQRLCTFAVLAMAQDVLAKLDFEQDRLIIGNSLPSA